MNGLDWLIILLYLGGIVVFSVWLSRKQADMQDYYLAGRTIKWWQSGASTMATQLSAVSFVSAPAFVALKQGGGLKWLSYEFAVPLALILVMAIIIPVFHRHKVISIYEFLEQRFDAGTRTLVSALFQLGRGLATAVAVLAGGLILSTALGITTVQAILLIGLITVIYDALGGIRIVILSDFFQMLIILLGIVVTAGVALDIVGWQQVWQTFPAERLQIIDLHHWGISSQGTYAFWPMLIGGFFLYASYYGCDQSQVQRELSVGKVDDVRKSLLVNAFGRFPLVLMYTMMGVFVGVLVMSDHGLQTIGQALNMSPEAVRHTLQANPDRMVPMFIVSYLPHGLIGFIFVAIMAALMSSLDSGINSLSAVTMKDIYQRYLKPQASQRHYLVASKLITFLWGVFCIAVAIALADTGDAVRQTSIVLINAVGSMLYGPILAAFLLAIFSDGLNGRSVRTGIIFGILFNGWLWLFTSVSWMWWNATGFLATGFVSLTVEYAQRNRIQWRLRPLREETSFRWRRVYLLVAGYFMLIILLTYWIEQGLL
ncbi:MAG TPA: sodium transporter [Caldithrix abyssi]|uniref:Sodium transporter n=1 Tax=Caldithrix abyssi TaxID=187145 RepID=A0A7V5UF33_CALAY|nr:sodium transporter [Caldithrix abyssi]